MPITERIQKHTGKRVREWVPLGGRCTLPRLSVLLGSAHAQMLQARVELASSDEEDEPLPGEAEAEAEQDSGPESQEGSEDGEEEFGGAEDTDDEEQGSDQEGSDATTLDEDALPASSPTEDRRHSHKVLPGCSLAVR